MKRLKCGLMCSCAMLALVPVRIQRAQAQEATPASLMDLTAGATYPLTLLMKDLDEKWRRVSITAQGEANPMAMFGLGTVPSDVYYTQGKMVKLGDETFIVAYRETAALVNFMAMMRGQAATKAPEPVSPQTALTLAYLNLRSISSLKNIAPFDLRAEIARRNTEVEDARQMMAQMTQNGGQGGAAEDLNSKSNSNLKQLGLGIMQYTQDHNQTFPPLEDAAAMKKEVMPYVKNEELFVHPGSKEAYQPNSSLSGKKLSSLAEPNSRVLAYEASAGTDGRRGVLYADGHVKRESETEWPQIKKASQVP